MIAKVRTLKAILYSSSLELCFMIAYVRTLKAILHFSSFSEPHEFYCLAPFMCPPPPSLELCFMIA